MEATCSPSLLFFWSGMVKNGEQIVAFESRARLLQVELLTSTATSEINRIENTLA